MTKIELEFLETVIQYLPKIAKALEKIAETNKTEKKK